MMYDAEAKMLAMKKMTPTEPPNSGPNARLIITNTIRQGQLRHGTVHMMYTCILGVHHGYESCLVPASNCCHCICHISLVPRPFFAEVLFLPGKKKRPGYETDGVYILRAAYPQHLDIAAQDKSCVLRQITTVYSQLLWSLSYLLITFKSMTVSDITYPTCNSIHPGLSKHRERDVYEYF